ncbi:MAG TPA: glycosyltransferase [Holophaga sp.]|nr:glycosyltransferase [Holophaga sp.]
MTPRLSVVLPTYNRVNWLMEALDSVLEPGLDCEVVVLDNGSGDGTWERLQARAAQDPRIRPLRWEVNNSAEAYPMLLEAARGEYVNFFADDDHMLPGGLARKMAALDAQPGVGMVFSPARCMDPEGRDLGEAAWTVVSPTDFPARSDLFNQLLMQNCMPMPTVLFRRSLAPSADVLRDPRFAPSHDWAFWLDMARRGSVAYLREPTVTLRQHAGQMSEVVGVNEGYFARVCMGIWRYWLLDAEPMAVPSPAVWQGMYQNLAGVLQATFKNDPARIREGLQGLQALRDAHGARLLQRLDAAEAGMPEVFLARPDWSSGEGPRLAAAFQRAFGPEDQVCLALLAAPGTAGAAQAALAARGLPPDPRIRILEPDRLLPVLREFPHLQWTGRGPLQGLRGRRLDAALRAEGGRA